MKETKAQTAEELEAAANKVLNPEAIDIDEEEEVCCAVSRSDRPHWRLCSPRHKLSPPRCSVMQSRQPRLRLLSRSRRKRWERSPASSGRSCSCACVRMLNITGVLSRPNLARLAAELVEQIARTLVNSASTCVLIRRWGESQADESCGRPRCLHSVLLGYVALA